MKISKELSSFRDPSGFLFFHDGEIYRQINKCCEEDYQWMISSGLYDRLTKKRKLVSHQEVAFPLPMTSHGYKVIKPEKVKFISYPYEWSFSQLKDAALLTLNIQKEALLSGMQLKDASAYNIQFQDGHPILIDTLSFSRYTEGDPWVAYQQFCQHFLASLALMSKKDVRLIGLLKNHINGIPLDLAQKLLPLSSRLQFGLLSHILLHAKAQEKINIESSRGDISKHTISKTTLVEIVENLEKTIKKLNWVPHGTDWLSYYQQTNYSEPAFDEKLRIVHDLLTDLKPGTLIDLGANTGIFSRQCAGIKDCYVISCDIDPGAVELNYLQVKQAREQYILPLVVDLTNPSPALGWNNQERKSFQSRAKADVILALALIHHLAISNNTPLVMIAQFLANMGKTVIIEFVPKEDSQVKRLLATRDDIFDTYTAEGFEEAMSQYFDIVKSISIQNTCRTIYVFERK
jgi:ribosomal protein L11 methylase PrmA